MSLVFNAIVHAILPEELTVLLGDAVVRVVDRGEAVDVDGRFEVRCREVLRLVVVCHPREGEAEEADGDHCGYGKHGELGFE